MQQHYRGFSHEFFFFVVENTNYRTTLC